MGCPGTATWGHAGSGGWGERQPCLPLPLVPPPPPSSSSRGPWGPLGQSGEKRGEGTIPAAKPCATAPERAEGSPAGEGTAGQRKGC